MLLITENIFLNGWKKMRMVPYQKYICDLEDSVEEIYLNRLKIQREIVSAEFRDME